MGGGESCDREAGAAVGGQPTDDNPAATSRFSDSHGRKIWMATVQDGDPAPRGGGDLIDRRRQSGGQLGQRRVADIDAGATAAEAKAVKQKQEHPP